MPENDKWKVVLKHFRRQDLDSVLKHRGLEIGATNRDELIGAMTKKSPDLCESICEPYTKLRGVSAQGIIQEIFLLENELGPIVANCRTKPQIVTKLFLADRLDVIDRVASWKTNAFGRFRLRSRMIPSTVSLRVV